LKFKDSSRDRSFLQKARTVKPIFYNLSASAIKLYLAIELVCRV
jgi:hypothetical protein